MAVIDIQQVPSGEIDIPQRVVNDFSINVATPNGSGSQTSNTAIIRALFKMGIPVNGKNLFPSNIQGLPTWYIIRLSKDGYRARKDGDEIKVCWNEQTFSKDVLDLQPGGVCIYPMDWRIQPPERDDIFFYRVPIKEIMAPFDIPRERGKYVANMIYVGALCWLLDIDLAQIDYALDYHFGGKRRAVDMNMQVVRAAHEWVSQNWEKKDPYFVEPMDGGANAGRILIEGNSAAALGATFGGVSLIAWYPITPSTSVVDAAAMWLQKYRHDADGKPTYAVIQAEDELAAIGMVLGGGWAGARAMTATSGPGISLMAEFAGMGYFAELPGVIWDIQRMGPSTGLPTRTSQGDVLFTHFLGHGDSKQIVLLPGKPEEAFEFGWKSFDIAEHFMTPVFVLSDLDLGMNYWTSEPFEYPDQPMNRGRILTPEQIEENGFARYKDKYGDGIGERTIPGTDHPFAAYFTRGTGHDEYGTYSEDPDIWEQNIERLKFKIENSRDELPQPIIDKQGGEKVIAILTYGTNDVAVAEARDQLTAAGYSTDYCRLRALPAANAALDFIRAYDHVYVVENNRDAQMTQILRWDLPEQAASLRPIHKCNGLPLTAKFITESILELEGK